MDVVYRLQGVAFEWDAQKALRNVEKHGVTFEEAAEVFFDPFYQYLTVTGIFRRMGNQVQIGQIA